MITTVRPLPIKTMLKSIKTTNNESIWCKAGQREILTHRSWISLHHIVEWFSNCYGRKPIIAFPKFYCYDTIYQIEKEAEVVYYDIDETLIPNYKSVTEENKVRHIDLLVFVHFFGFEFQINDAKVFCKSNQTFLIEDAVHVMYPKSKIGKNGDFVLYSPWKNIGLPDGAILVINPKGPNRIDVDRISQWIEKKNDCLKEYPARNVNVWKIKRIIQKICPNRKVKGLNTESAKVHYEQTYRISTFSKNFLLKISEVEVNQIGDKKRINKLIVEECLKEQYSKCKIDRGKIIPYTAVFETDDSTEIWTPILRMGQVAFKWPTIAEDIDENDPVRQIKEKYLHIAIHDGMSPSYIYKKLETESVHKEQSNIVIKSISEKEYIHLCNNVLQPLPILQSQSYTKAKENAQGWKKEFWEVCIDKKRIGFFASLKKYNVIYRINRGPCLWEKSYKFQVYQAIKAKFGSHGKILFFAPEEEQTGNNIKELLNMGYIYRNSYFSTGFLNLRESEETLRKNMDSKWRNQLKTCEKLGLQVLQAKDIQTFEKLTLIHQRDKMQRHYKDSGDSVTEYLYRQGNLSAFYVNGENDNIISMVMLAIHNKTATYYIGWSNEEGHRKNVNRFLLWKSILYLKMQGIEWLDMGGIDLINTKSIAEFKLGIGCSYINLVGEFMSF